MNRKAPWLFLWLSLASCFGAGACAEAPARPLAAAPPAATASSSTTATSPAPAGRPRYRRIHVDHVDPAKVAQFEGARRDWLALLSAKRAGPAPEQMLQVDGSTFLTVRPFGSFGDIDAMRAKDGKVDEIVGEDAIARIDERSHGSLVPPHHNEIWTFREDLSYLPRSSPLDESSAGYRRLVADEVFPPRADRYAESLKATRDALGKVDYRLPRLVFSASIGSGRYLSFWLAESRERFAQEPTYEDALGRALGKAEADALLQRTRDCISNSQTSDVTLRKDLSITAE